MTRLSKLCLLLCLLPLPALACAPTPTHSPSQPLAKGEVALTFDDGPVVDTTPTVLKILQDHCAKATFFMIGKRVDASPDLVRAVRDAGHTIGAHSWSHIRMDTLDTSAQLNDFNRTLTAMQDILGQPVQLYRFPELKTTPSLLDEAKKRQIGIINMDISADDWKNLQPAEIVATVRRKLQEKGGGIILMHDARANMTQALPDVLKMLEVEKYKIVQLVP